MTDDNMDIITNNKEIVKGGCILKATKIINKTAAKLDRIVKKSTTITVWSIRYHKKLLLAIVIMLLQIAPLTTMAAALPASVPSRTQHLPIPIQIESSDTKILYRQQQQKNSYLSQMLPHKSSLLSSSLDSDKIINLPNILGSNSKPYDTKNLITPFVNKKKKHRIRSLVSPEMSWQNPCGGRYNGNIVHKHKKITIQSRREAYKHLRDAINLANEYDFNSGPIPINDIGDWMKHAETYKFLPVVRPKSNITLVRWHSQMQRYVGVISHLSRPQDKGRRNRDYRNNELHELYQLLHASKKVLCAIETAINSTQIRPRIQRYSEQEMNRYVEKLQTTNMRISEIDLKYVKVNYINTTKGMMKALSKKIREMNCRIQERRYNSSLNNDYNASASMSVSKSLSLDASSSNSKQQNDYNKLFDVFNSNNNNSGSISESINNMNLNSSSKEGGFKRSKICQRILERRKNKKNTNKNKKSDVNFG